MTCSTSFRLLIGALVAALACVKASIYPVQSRLWIPPFQHAEKMFASNRGPIFARQGDSTIQIDVEGGNITQDMDDWRLVVLFYHVDSFETFSTIEDQVELLACTDDTEHVLALTGMSAVQKQVFPVQNETVKASAQYIVNTSGWTNTQIFICSDRNGAAEVLPFKGTMEIRNPFGLLPAVLYGMIPFSALLTVGYLMLFGFFSVLLVRHRKQVIQLHYGILLVLLMGTAATAAWFYAFFRMNQTGEPVCCPYPTTFLVAVVLDTLMRTLARLILIVVCLGYGIVRAHLRRGEVVLVTFLSLAYFVSGIGDEVTRGTSSGIEFREKPTAWTLVQLLCNLMFIMWIHYSLEQIIKQLSEQKQSAKLAMYKSLAWSLAGFIVFFTLLTLVAVCSRVGVFDWDVEWEWMQLVAWPVLNFIVSAAMCVIWRPTKNSSQFAFSMQLPMSADDAEDGATGIEMPSPFAHTSDSEDEEIFNASDMVSRDEIEIELSPAKDTKTGKKTVHHADDDDEEGL